MLAKAVLWSGRWAEPVPVPSRCESLRLASGLTTAQPPPASRARAAAPRVRYEQLHGPMTLIVGPGTTVVPLDVWRIAFTVPDRPSPLVTVTTPETDCQNTPIANMATFGTSGVVPSGRGHGGKSYLPGPEYVPSIWISSANAWWSPENRSTSSSMWPYTSHVEVLSEAGVAHSL